MEYEAGGKEISFDLRLSGIANVHLGLKPFAKTGSIIHSLGEADQGPQAHEPYRQIWGHRLQLTQPSACGRHFIRSKIQTRFEQGTFINQPH